jgi:[ribosomal protein S5]-alanine N-acetyltransferase
MFPELQTNRFLLKQVKDNDQAFLFEGLGDPVAMPYNGVYFESYEATRAQIDYYNRYFKEGSGIPWKIVDKATGENIGVVSVYKFMPEHRKAELGYWLLPRFWGQGIAVEVIKTVIDYWQQNKGLHRLEAYVEEENVGSIRVMEKLHFTHEGTLRDCEIKFGKFISLRIYSCLSNIEKQTGS